MQRTCSKAPTLHARFISVFFICCYIISTDKRISEHFNKHCEGNLRSVISCTHFSSYFYLTSLISFYQQFLLAPSDTTDSTAFDKGVPCTCSSSLPCRTIASGPYSRREFEDTEDPCTFSSLEVAEYLCTRFQLASSFRTRRTAGSCI